MVSTSVNVYLQMNDDKCRYFECRNDSVRLCVCDSCCTGAIHGNPVAGYFTSNNHRNDDIDDMISYVGYIWLCPKIWVPLDHLS